MNPDLALITFCMLPQGTLITVNQQSRNLRINNKNFSWFIFTLALSESNFETSASIDYTPILGEKNNQPLTYLQFTLRSIEEVTVPDTCLRMRGGCYIFYS